MHCFASSRGVEVACLIGAYIMRGLVVQCIRVGNSIEDYNVSLMILFEIRYTQKRLAGFGDIETNV